MIGVNSVAEESDPSSRLPLWGHLKAGPFPVGFRSISSSDAGRPAFRDEDGKLLEENQGRFIQVNLWYPAVPQAGVSILSFADYFYLRGYETSSDITTEAAMQRAHDRFWEYIERNPKDLSELLGEIPMAAFSDVEPSKGKFPLVLLAHGSAMEWCILAEYLASHGFVVVHAPCTGTFEKDLDVGLSGVETEIRDLEFILKQASEFSFVDRNTIATLGFSFGAMGAAGLATRNPDVKAIVSFDGGIGSDWGGYVLSNTPYYDVTRLNVPILHLYSNRDPGTDLRWFDDYKYSSRYLVSFSQMRHADFTAHAVLETFLPGIQSEPPYGDAKTGYQWVCRYTLHFLKTYLKDDSLSNEFLNQPPEANGVPPGILTMVHRPGRTLPPDANQLLELLKTDGFGQLLSVYQKLLKDDSQPLPQRTFHRVWRYLTELKQFENAETWASFFLDAYPDSAGALFRVASTANHLGHSARAILCYRRALEALPDDPILDNWYRHYYRDSIERSLADLQSLELPYSVKEPLDHPVPFAGGNVKTINGITFTPDGRSLYVTLQLNEENADGRKRAGIFRQDYVNGTWSEPRRAEFSRQYTNYQPIFSPDGKKLFFTSTRPLPDENSEVRQNVWFVERKETGWSEPQIVPALITPKWDGHAMPVEDGALYYASERDGGSGDVDIWRSQFSNGQYMDPKNVKTLNSSDTDNDFYIDPFERFIIFTRYIEAENDLDLYVSLKTEAGWSKPRPLDMINTDKWELSPSVSPDGKYFFFLREGTIYQIPLQSILSP